MAGLTATATPTSFERIYDAQIDRKDKWKRQRTNTLVTEYKLSASGVAENEMKEIKENRNVDYEKERRLIARFKQGYQPAFNQLISLYQQKIFRLAYGFFQDRDDAMEIVQETFIRVHKKIDGFNESDAKTRFNNWIYRIAYNLCIDYYRKFRKKKADLKDLYQFDEDLRTSSTNPEDQLDLQNFRNNLKKTVQRLPRRQKMVFVLRHYSGFKHHEISDMLGVSLGTVKSLYHRAVLGIKKKLGSVDSLLQDDVG